MTFVDYLTNLRVTKARQLLRDQSLSIAEISNLVGFTDQSYFDKRFGTFRQIAARMPGNGKIVVKKGKIFLAALARRPQYFGLIKNAWRIRRAV